MRRDTAQLLQERRIAWRKRLRRARLLLLLVLGTVLTWRVSGGVRSDASVYDQRTFVVDETLDGDSFRLRDDAATVVVLLGVDAPELPEAHFAGESATYLSGRLTAKTVLLRLDGTQTRDARGRLAAYVYLSESDLINADIVRDGRAFADRRRAHTFRAQIEQLEAEARRKRRGLWERIDAPSIEENLRMPEWRRRWLATLRESNRSSDTPE